MKNKKGYTLIELLAVIIILAIIALVSIPIVINMIGNAKKKAAEDSSLGYIDAIEHYTGLVDSDVEGYDVKLPIKYGSITCVKDHFLGWNEECEELFEAIDSKTKGSKPTSAVITIDSNGKVVSGSKLVYNNIKSTYNGKEIVYNNDYKCISAKIKNSGAVSSSAGGKITTSLNPNTLIYCDVDGNGNFVNGKELFNYVTDLDSNPDYAVLVAYEPFKDETEYYGEDTSPDAFSLLPTTEDWPNVSLTNTERKVSYTNRFGQTTTTNLSYEGYAARMLSRDEIIKACGEGDPTKLNYFIKKCGSTFKTGWIESSVDWMITDKSNRSLSYSNNENHVYPVIEVLKTDIDF